MIIQKTTFYIVNGQKFRSEGAAFDHINEKLAQFLCDDVFAAAMLSPSQKVKRYQTLRDLSYDKRKKIANMVLTEIEGD